MIVKKITPTKMAYCIFCVAISRKKKKLYCVTKFTEAEQFSSWYYIHGYFHTNILKKKKYFLLCCQLNIARTI